MAVVCPGSRSTPLTMAFAAHLHITTLPVLDERSAAFFALGRAKKTGLPTALICTSGTAGANFYPAVIEAKESGIPLIILTADRPAELRHCHAGQTIDQVKLYGNLPNWQCELALPEANLNMLSYLRQNAIQAWKRSLFPTPGVVHINLPFREPLAPLVQPEVAELKKDLIPEDFLAAISEQFAPDSTAVSSGASLPFHHWQQKSGIIIAGLAQPQDPEGYCRAIACLSRTLSFPVLAEALSPLRNYAELNPYLISTYDSILRQHEIAMALVPEVVIQIGELPTSKILRQWLNNLDVRRWIIERRSDNFDPLHGKTIHLRGTIERLVDDLQDSSVSLEPSSLSEYCQQWCSAEIKTRNNLDLALKSLNTLYEGKVAWLLSQSLPTATPIFLANSMSIRNAEYFWQPNDRRIVPYFSRGANGIDGTLSTALGIAYQDRGILLTGDLALLHDTNGFLVAQKFSGHLTIIVINNRGGGIFEMLPIANFSTEFEEYFATPQAVNISRLCAAYGIEHQTIRSWLQLENLLQNLPEVGIRVLEINCDRHLDATWLKDNLGNFSQ